MAAFFCACIAEAFVSDDVEHIIETGLQMIPKESVYAKVSRAVIAFYRENPDDWRACHELLVREWGYDKYRGVCHIIPNAGVCVLSMLYGKGDFARTVEIATMCGWDTDCNAGNVGTVLGVLCGPEGLPGRYRKPVNDGIVYPGKRRRKRFGKVFVTGRFILILSFPVRLITCVYPIRSSAWRNIRRNMLIVERGH